MEKEISTQHPNDQNRIQLGLNSHNWIMQNQQQKFSLFKKNRTPVYSGISTLKALGILIIRIISNNLNIIYQKICHAKK